MHSGAVIPDNDVTHLPVMRVNIVRSGSTLGEIEEKALALLDRPAGDVRGVCRKIEGFATGSGISSN
jgi:hypothetical protein